MGRGKEVMVRVFSPVTMFASTTYNWSFTTYM